MARASYQKHFGILFDEKLNFKQRADNAIIKVSKAISVIKNLRYNLTRKSLVTICKAFLWPIVDYGYIIYDQTQNKPFCEKIIICTVQSRVSNNRGHGRYIL